ncbi:MAG: helix-turn-helix domain-containing protein [Mesorhizobium sp.]|uniref:XRE family transcriptional regulator n=1 Tax=Mesorhizobium sp. TaxID=1871066 RepID=UPI000FE47C6C|nr:helix-turn-helix domain-containing protein [Mesorhizobium sp.]RWE81926.1 MAG: helix-turn-helix domain-containing protein [Mesorhizobium sp.]TJW62291.1 MAG: helix-turn-helix domain-containing protein [Mesorhizobium sp.]
MIATIRTDSTTLGQRLRQAREAAGLTQNDIADHFKIKRVSVTQWEADTTRPSMERLPKLATLLKTDVAWLLDASGAAPVPIVREPKPRASRTPIIPGDELVGGRDLPIYAAAMGGEGHMIVTFEAIDWVKRPAVLQNVRGGYGILVRGESMIPAYWPGDTALVNPHLQPARDSDAVFFHTPPKERGDEEAIIKRLVGMNDRQWTLEQYRPAKTFSESRVDWPICHRVVGKYNAR